MSLETLVRESNIRVSGTKKLEKEMVLELCSGQTVLNMKECGREIKLMVKVV